MSAKALLLCCLLATVVPCHGATVKCLPPSLKTMLTTIEKRFGKVKVLSTYRKGARIAGTNRPSRHASCRAVDFHPARGAYKAVLSYLRKHHDGGLGTYSGRMRHLHIDDGPRVRFHHCVGCRKSKGKK